MKIQPSFWLAILALGPLAATGLRAEAHKPGAELRVNAVTEAKLHNPTAAWNDGRALVVWDNDRTGIKGRFLGADGAAASAELSLVANQILTGIPAAGIEVTRKDAAVAFLPKGQFFLFWTEERSSVRIDHFYENREVVDRDVIGLRFSASGAPLGARFRVNSDAAGFQSRPKALTLPSGNVLVVFESDDSQAGVGAGDGIFGRLVNVAGQAASGVFKINADNGQPAANPALAADARGSFLVSWETGSGREQDVIARLFDRNGVARIPEFRVNSEVAGLQRRPAVAADPAGGFVVVWQGQVENNWRKARIFGQFLAANGSVLGPAFPVSSGYGEAQISPSVVAVPGRSFLVTWIDYGQTFPIGLAAAHIDAQGAVKGDEIWINESVVGAQSRTSIAGENGRFLVPYEGYFQNGAQGINARVLTID
jgi:hypothetical protein